MKLFYIFLGIAVFSLAGASFYYTNLKKEETHFNVATSTPQAESIYIYREYGDISFKNKAASTFTSVTDTKMTIANFATVKTGNGRGYVIFPDNSSIALSTSTEIQISYEPTKISIMQLLGSTYHRVTSLATGNKYEVRTPNTLAAIRGTKLAVIYNPNLKKTYIAVTEHQVEVTPTKEDGTLSNAPVMVQERSLADIQSSTSTPKIGTSTLMSSVKMVMRSNDDVKEIKIFIDENKIIDKAYDKTPLEMRKEFLEKLINSLQKESLQTPPSGENSSLKIESRIDILNRVIKQITSTIKTPTSVTPQASVPVTTAGTNTLTPVKVQPVTPITIGETKKLVELPTNVEEFTPEQEDFINSFYITYERYFLVDDPQAYCKRLGTITPKDMVASLLAISNKAGFIMPKQAELSSFATDLVSACADGSIQNKATTFKTRFDVTYSY